MHLANESHLPTPISSGEGSTLGDLLDEGTGREKSYVVQIAHNMGNRTFLMSVPLKEFRDISVVANERSENGEAVAQRPLDKLHARKLAKYVLKGLVAASIKKRVINGQPESSGLAVLESALGKQPYLALQPIVCNLRNVDPGGKQIRGDRLVDKVSGETAGFKIFLSQESILYVVDGQHRRKGIEFALEFISQAIADQKLGKTGNLLHPGISGELDTEIVQALYELQEVASGFCTVQVECHLGLGIPEERQLFHDMNNLSKKISTSMALDFDSSNPVNNFIKEVLADDIITWGIIEKDIADWQHDKGDIVRKDLVGINARLILNKTNISGATPAMLEQRGDVAQKFWETVVQIPDLGQAGAKMKTVAAQPVVLKAMAKLVYDFAFGKLANEEYLEKIWQGILSLDYSHANPMWRYYLFSEDERRSNGLDGLAEYLPADDEGYNRDIGGYDPVADTFRFGAKQNDIVPILGDMMRWNWGLPSRQKR